MEDAPKITYQVTDSTETETVVDISIDRPINGFYGTRLRLPAVTGSKAEQAAAIRERVQWKVRQELGSASAGLTIQSA